MIVHVSLMLSFVSLSRYRAILVWGREYLVLRPTRKRERASLGPRDYIVDFCCCWVPEMISYSDH